MEEKKPITLVLKDEEVGRIFYKKVKHTAMIVGMTYLVKGRWVKVLKIINKSKKKPKGAIFSEFANWELPDSDTINKILESLKQTPGNIIEFKSTPIKENYIYKLYKETKEEKERRVREKKELAKLRQRPYFRTMVDIVRGKPLGKENLEKIKFPCYCEYRTNYGKFLGEINSSFTMGCGQEYILSCIERQGCTSIVERSKSFKEMMEAYDIEILKGELKLWKVVEQKGE